ncbi:ABC transporter ATP-binding protein [Staphylococcus sp. IPLA37010]|uniref:ABC transporter ATP-binding protein n=1 Tax=Staphylococcus equorum TaxID=246432 RepID=A0AAW7AFR2_9STAP|nr:ABC transporter ATP-binding protein [Staphylococcus equorum]MDK9864565.1 ABC transporter ATP-binding protein [Staphylococcus equorum]
MLEFKNVTKSFKDGNQTIEAVKPTSGEIIINDKHVSQLSLKELAKTRMQEIGFILQATNLVPFLNVKQQFKLLQKQKKDVLDEASYNQLVKQLDIAVLENKLPSEISGGQKQRVAIAKALYTKPSIILADEPTASLDTNNAMEVMKILKEQTMEQNKTCIVVTHDERLTEYCDSVYHMEDGMLTLTQDNKS